ncbi:hypothetical protein [Pseudarthrobacter enclensis]|uniref:hypothetical protein n=1 Tax=Pseudarthrobacter enclensis TaxID=993070 RepID=UPI003EE421BC
MYRSSAVQELLRRWPHVPTRELDRIHRALIHCQQTQHPGNAGKLTEPALALLDLVTAELSRRRLQAGKSTPSPADEQEVPRDGRSF